MFGNIQKHVIMNVQLNDSAKLQQDWKMNIKYILPEPLKNE